MSSSIIFLASLLGQLLSSYGLWGYGINRANSAWFPLTVILFAAALLGVCTVVKLYRSLLPAVLPAGPQVALVAILLILLPLQEFIIGVVAQGHGSTSSLFSISGQATVSMTVIVRAPLARPVCVCVWLWLSC